MKPAMLQRWDPAGTDTHLGTSGEAKSRKPLLHILPQLSQHPAPPLQPAGAGWHHHGVNTK